jgi:hypothetical protein
LRTQNCERSDRNGVVRSRELHRPQRARLTGDKLAVPGGDGVRPRDSHDLGKGLAAQAMTDLPEHGSLSVRELQSPINWLFRMRFSAAGYSFRAQRDGASRAHPEDPPAAGILVGQC